jgi:uncharacterized MAPEG superfamily protein
MTVPFQCLLVIVFLPYLWAGVGAYLMSRNEAIDNKYHRVQQARQTGAPARAFGAHYNALEATPMFAAAVITAHLFQADPSASAQAALAFVVLRVLHGIFYLADRDLLRGGAFIGGLACVGRLFQLAV